MRRPPAIIVHGGAREIPPEKRPANRDGCRAAAQAGWEVLARGGSALEAVETAIRALEADPTFNAGRGSTLNPDGVVRMDAGLMEGKTFAAGAVAAIEGVRHPISVARVVLEAEEVMLAAEHAHRFARERGAELCDPAELITEEKRKSWEEEQGKQGASKGSNDTVGCVALDAEGNLAAGASTGGTGTKTPGRVGDSPIVGAGFYAENGVGGCSLTGEGEDILRLGLARVVIEQLRAGASPQAAVDESVRLLGARTPGKGGCIVLDGEGRLGWAHSEPQMAVAYRTAEMSAPVAYVAREEEAESRPASVAA